MKIIQNSNGKMWINNPISNRIRHFSAVSNCSCDTQCGCDDYCYRDGDNKESTLTCTGSISH